MLAMAVGLACAGAPRAPLLAQVGPPPTDLPPAEETPSPTPAPPRAEPGEAAAQPPVAVDERTRTAGGALAAFMASRNYHSIRALKAVMTPRLQARFDQDSVPFNGKRGARIAAFDFQENDLKLVPPPRLKGAAAAAKVTQVPAPPPEEVYVATVRTLWEEQGEAVELRVESLRVARQDDGSWRVGSLDKVSADGLRFTDPVPGVTALRMVLRGWHRRDLAAARALMSPAFLKRHQGREETLRAIFVGGEDPRHAAFQILDLKPEGALDEVAKVRLFETHPGQPAPIAGSPVTLRLIKKGPRWLLDAWD